MKCSLRSTLFVLLGLVALALLAPPPRALSGQPPESLKKPNPTAAVPEEVQVLIQDRNYPAAIAAIDKAIAEGRGPADYLTYLKGRAFHHQKKYGDAVKTLDGLVASYPGSPWVRRAKFAK